MRSASINVGLGEVINVIKELKTDLKGDNERQGKAVYLYSTFHTQVQFKVLHTDIHKYAVTQSMHDGH